MPPLLWILVAVLLFLFVLGGPGNLLGLGAGILIALLLFVPVVVAKRLNARIVITAQSVESRDAWGRTRRCERKAIDSMVAISGMRWFGPSIQQVRLVDAEGGTLLSLAWDSYSDAQLDEIRRALGIRLKNAAG